MNLKKLQILALLILSVSTAYSQQFYFDIYNLNADEFPKTKAYVIAKQPMGLDIPDLNVSDFKIVENGVDVTAKAAYKCEKTKEVLPVSAVLVLDASTSMGEPMDQTGQTRFYWTKIAANAFIDSVKYVPGTAVSIITFAGIIDRNAGWMFAPTPLHGEMTNYKNASGTTNFNVPFLNPPSPNNAFTRLKERPENIRRVVVFLSDGWHESLTPFKKSEVIKSALDAHAQVFMVSINSPYNSDMFEIADSTGGKYFIINNKDSLLAIYRRISQEIQSNNLCWLEWNQDYICEGDSKDRNVSITFNRAKPPKTITKSYTLPDNAVAKIELPPTLFYGKKGDGAITHDIPIKGISGTTTVTGYSISPNPGDFTIDWKGNTIPFTVKTGEIKTITLNYTKDPSGAPQEYQFKLATTPCESNPIAVVAPCGGDYLQTYDLSAVPSGSLTQKSIACAYKNTTTKPITGNVTLEGADKAQFNILKGAGAFTLQPNQCLDIDISITPIGTGPKNAEIRYNIPDDCGEPVTKLTANAVPVDFPIDALDFGPVRVQTSSKKTYTITNKTLTDAKITKIELKDASDKKFAMTNANALPYTLQPGKSINIEVTFSPIAEGNFSNDVNFTIENLAKPAVGSLKGVGFLPQIQADTLVFPDTKVGLTSAPMNLVIKNKSAYGPLTLSKIDLPGNEFAFVTAPPANVVVPIGGSVSYPVTFKPAMAGLRAANADITNDAAPGVNPIVVTKAVLKGNGLQTGNTSIDFGNISTCDEPVKTVSIKNTSSSAMNVSITKSGAQAYAFNLDKTNFTVPRDSTGSFNLTFSPDVAGNYDASLNVTTSVDNSVITIKGSGFVQDQATSFAEPQIKINAGLAKLLDFTAELPNIGQKKYSVVNYVVEYDPTLMQYVENSFEGAAGWTWTVDNADEVKGKILISGKNTGGISGGVNLANKIGFKSFISNKSRAKLMVHSEFDNSYDCINSLTDTVEVESQTCFNEGALITISSNNYMMNLVTPNPASDIVKFNYELAFDSHVKLEIYDSFGQKVRIVTDAYEKAGKIDKTANLSNLASGVYYYIFEAGQHRESNKIIISK